MKTCVMNNISISCIPSLSFSLCFSLTNHRFHPLKHLDARNTAVLQELSWELSLLYRRISDVCVLGISLGPALCRALGDSLDIQWGVDGHRPPGLRHSWLHGETLTNGNALPKRCAVLRESINNKEH